MFGSGPRARFGSSLRPLRGLSTSRTPAAAARMTFRRTQARTIIGRSFLCPRRVTSEQRKMACGRHEKERSEEHTSELQSQSNIVCRLLLEKKKNNNENR